MVRVKNRYLLVEIVWQDQHNVATLTAQMIFEEIRKSVQTNFGDFGSGVLGETLKGLFVVTFKSIFLSVIALNTKTNKFIVKSNRSQNSLLWAALLFIRKIHGDPCLLRVLHCGGLSAPWIAKSHRPLQELSELVSRLPSSTIVQCWLPSSICSHHRTTTAGLDRWFQYQP